MRLSLVSPLSPYRFVVKEQTKRNTKTFFSIVNDGDKILHVFVHFLLTSYSKRKKMLFIFQSCQIILVFQSSTKGVGCLCVKFLFIKKRSTSILLICSKVFDLKTKVHISFYLTLDWNEEKLFYWKKNLMKRNGIWNNGPI